MSSRPYRHRITNLDVCHNCLHCCPRCHFSVVLIVTLSPASLCPYHGFRPTLPRFTGFARQLVRMLAIFFYFDCRFLSTFVDAISVVCMSSLPPPPPLRTYFTLHRCPHCCHHYIVVCIIVAMSSLFVSYIVTFRLFAQQLISSLFVYFVLLYVVAFHRYVASTRHLLSLLCLVTFRSFLVMLSTQLNTI